ncbi:MAG TPA: response regulator [Sulfuricurvum sp.]|nr:response regulator [Sulfuricurvum sp.]HQT35589.1 response regulator [Sulfuricurvum sp.]
MVDDQSLNQTLIAAYINQYCEQNGDILEIQTANDGIQAVTLCQEQPFDLIFMDILMPKMNGIDATKHIISILPNALIIIVSTQGDEENQIQALRNGAKDYFLKPIQPDVFKRRLQLYMNMMKNDTSPVSSSKSINPFTNATFCYKTTYLIENEEDLTQLWESMLSIKNSVRSNFLSDLIRFMYQLGQVMLSRQVQPQIIMEENEEYYFFSITNINILPKAKISQLIESYLKNSTYEFSANLLSFKIAKESSQILAPEIQNVAKDAIPSVKATYHKENEALQKFTFMEEEDITSLELRLNELATQFMWMGSNELNRDDVDQIISAFERTSSILMLYSETQTLGIAIRDLISIIQRDEKVFIDMAAQMSTLCKSFNNDLIIWFKSIFYEGAPSINFMDASIISNIQMVQSFLLPAEEIPLDDADGFEFF